MAKFDGVSRTSQNAKVLVDGKGLSRLAKDLVVLAAAESRLDTWREQMEMIDRQGDRARGRGDLAAARRSSAQFREILRRVRALEEAIRDGSLLRLVQEPGVNLASWEVARASDEIPF